MTFYLQPPKGLAYLKNLEEAVQERQTFYQNSNSVDIRDVILQLECLCEDKVLDRLGHFIFRFAATQNKSFRDVFLTNEVKLLDIRLSCYSEDDVKFMLGKLRKQGADLYRSIGDGEVRRFLLVLLRVFTGLLDVVGHGYQHDWCDRCNAFIIKVNFQLCPDLLATRLYNISRGVLQINSFQWKSLLLSLYKYYLKLMLKYTHVKSALDDERIGNIVEIVLSPYSVHKGRFTLGHFNLEHKLFPPCMRNLYDILMNSNRLSHNARFNFSLYLKDIGLSMEDSLKFWEETYTKPHKSCSKCTHSWEENKKRYIYGIRHLYGLEGARRRYSVKSCQALQEESTNEEGGCPFSHWDDEHLRRMLKRYLPPSSYDQVEVIIYEKRNPKVGCELFLDEFRRSWLGKEFDGGNFHDPAQYYLLSKCGDS